MKKYKGDNCAFYMRGYLLAFRQNIFQNMQTWLTSKAAWQTQTRPVKNVNQLRESNTPNKRASLKNATPVVKKARAVEQVALFVALAFQTKIDKSLSDGA